jgi:nicotinate phosphoribosyltransferase
MVDRSIVGQMGAFDPRGVNPQLVRNVREALDAEGFASVRITVSGGFDPEKIARFEREQVPVDSYGVGSALFAGRFDFTADIVEVDGRLVSKAGRSFVRNPRLERVE